MEFSGTTRDFQSLTHSYSLRAMLTWLSEVIGKIPKRLFNANASA